MRKYLILSIAFNLLLVTAFVIKRVAYKPVDKNEIINSNYRNARIEYLKSIPNDSIVFIGTSLTEGLRTKGTNLGIAGARTADILKLLPVKAKVIYLEIGINDLANGISVDSAYKNYQKILQGLEGKVVRQSVPYLTEGYQKDWKRVNEKIKEFNLLIRPDIILPCGDSLTYDGLHYNKRGYEVWEGEIKKCSLH